MYGVTKGREESIAKYSMELQKVKEVAKGE